MNIKSDSFFIQKTEVTIQFNDSVEKQAIFNRQAIKQNVFGIIFPVLPSFLLKEDGFFLLQENGDKLIIQ